MSAPAQRSSPQFTPRKKTPQKSHRKKAEPQNTAASTGASVGEWIPKFSRLNPRESVDQHGIIRVPEIPPEEQVKRLAQLVHAQRNMVGTERRGSFRCREDIPVMEAPREIFVPTNDQQVTPGIAGGGPLETRNRLKKFVAVRSQLHGDVNPNASAQALRRDSEAILWLEEHLNKDSGRPLLYGANIANSRIVYPEIAVGQAVVHGPFGWIDARCPETQTGAVAAALDAPPNVGVYEPAKLGENPFVFSDEARALVPYKTPSRRLDPNDFEPFVECVPRAKQAPSFDNVAEMERIYNLDRDKSDATWLAKNFESLAEVTKLLSDERVQLYLRAVELFPNCSVKRYAKMAQIAEGEARRIVRILRNKVVNGQKLGDLLK